MALFSILAAAIAPGISLMTYFYLKDRYDAEPLHMVIKMFVIGTLIVLPLMVLQRGMVLGMGNHPLLGAFIISAFMEEFMKWFVLYHMIYNHTEFDEPYDGIVYAVAVSLGFATLENIFYAWFDQSTFGTLIVRALLPVSGHALFGVMMGYYFGKAKFSEKRQAAKYLALSLCYPVLWHGMFNYILSGTMPYWSWFIVPLMGVLWIRGLRSVRRANARSPFSVFHTPGED